MKNIRKMLLIAFIVAVGTTFSLNFFMEGFIITLSIILLPVLIYAYEPLEPFPTCLVVAVISPGFRTLISYASSHDFFYSFRVEAPSFMFYVMYGIVYTALYWERKHRDITRLIVAVLLADFLSNLLEVTVRSNIAGLDLKMIKDLLIIALVRTVIAACAIMALKYYRSFLSREEHEARYRRLMMLMSSFKSEIYFMNMNMRYIESIMGKSFKAYKVAEEIGASPELRNLALDISKDVHEIKKDYIRVIKGLEEMSETRMELKPMNIQDMVALLIDSLKESSESGNLAVEIVTEVDADISVGEHFYLMSVLRNLVVNAIEACEGRARARVELTVTQSADAITIQVKDNGNGIKAGDVSYIFNPGFSTKYDPESGDMNRGLGLTLVREMVEKHFGGSISVESIPGSYTLFTVSIPLNRLEERPL